MPTIRQQPADMNLEVYMGDTFQVVLVFRADGEILDLTGVWRSQIRPKPGQDVQAIFDIDDSQAEVGELTLKLDPDVTAALGIALGGIVTSYVWDLEWTNTLDQVQTMVAGTIKVTSDVTRDVPL